MRQGLTLFLFYLVATLGLACAQHEPTATPPSALSLTASPSATQLAAPNPTPDQHGSPTRVSTPAPTPPPSPVPTPSPAPTALLPDLVKVADLPGGHISDIAFAPSNPDVVYLASNVNAMGVWRSDDAGESWQRVFYDKYGATHTNVLAVHPTNAQIVLVGDLHGRITKTSDGGSRWTDVYQGESPVFALAISPS